MPQIVACRCDKSCDDQGMTLNEPAHYLRGGHVPAPDPLTDSGMQRALGTVVRLHLPEKRYVDVGLTDIRGVTTWRDLVERISRHAPIETLGLPRRVFAAGVVVYAEAVSDWPADT